MFCPFADILSTYSRKNSETMNNLVGLWEVCEFFKFLHSIQNFRERGQEKKKSSDALKPNWSLSQMQNNLLQRVINTCRKSKQKCSSGTPKKP